MYTKVTYVEAVQRLIPRYKRENMWFARWWPKDDEDTLYNGWRMYEKASQNGLGFLLLGDTAIRTNKALLLNFGLTSAHGVQEEKDRAMIKQLMNQRRAIATPSMPAVKLKGPGSILSDKEWSPLLNDSFILGGIKSCQEFHLADDAFHAFNPVKPIAAPSLVAQRREMFGQAAKGYAPNPSDLAKDKWKAYFQATPTVFWNLDYNVPRVFAREVIGLKTFGYKPVWSLHELGFVCAEPNRATSADFLWYLNALSDVNFGDADRARIMAVISEYLFGAKGVIN
jgi:hypothetical protein